MFPAFITSWLNSFYVSKKSLKQLIQNDTVRLLITFIYISIFYIITVLWPKLWNCLPFEL